MPVPQLTIAQLMALVAMVAAWLAIVQSGVALLFLGSAFLTYVPSFLWAAGKEPLLGELELSGQGRGELFLRAWLLCTLGVVLFCYALQALARF